MNLFTTRTRVTAEQLQALPPPETWWEAIVRERDMVVAGPSRYGERFLNSVIIGFTPQQAASLTLEAVASGTASLVTQLSTTQM